MTGGAKLRGTASQVKHMGLMLLPIFMICWNPELKHHRLIEIYLCNNNVHMVYRV